MQKIITLCRYAIDPSILAVSAKTWMSLSPEDRQILREVGELMMAVQKKEAREGLENAAIVVDVLEKIYQMDVTRRDCFRLRVDEEVFLLNAEAKRAGQIRDRSCAYTGLLGMPHALPP